MGEMAITTDANEIHKIIRTHHKLYSKKLENQKEFGELLINMT